MTGVAGGAGGLVTTEELKVKGGGLSEPLRREVFAALVAAQVEGLGVKASRGTAARRSEVGERVVSKIEEGGLDKGWPPLGKA
jgi:hypothetical protein